MPRPRASLVPCLLGLASLTCTGQIESARNISLDDGGAQTAAQDRPERAAAASGEPESASSQASDAAAMSGWPRFDSPRAFQLRRLTTQQYVSSVKALLGVDTSGMPAIERVSPVGGFEEIGASTASVSGQGVAQFEDAARFLAHAAFVSGGPGRSLLPCTPSGVADTACFRSFVHAFGDKAFRRPLSDEEATRYAALTRDVAEQTGDAWQGVEATASAFLQSPNFLYLAEVAEPDPSDAQRYRYGSYELAARLSYFLSGGAPDEALLAAAKSGKLTQREELSAQAARLLEQSGAHDALRRFFSGLLALDNLDTLTRPKELFPQFTSTLGPALKQETLLVLDDLIFARNADYRSVFAQTETFVNAELAAFYGVPAPRGSGFSKLSLPASTHRAGLLGHAGVLAARDHSDGTSPTRRGLFVLTRLLCQDVPLMPPANLQIPPPPTGRLTARERLDEHATNAACAGCHHVTDPVGLSLEHFDALGSYREDDHGLAIDDLGAIEDRDYHGEIELGALLRDHPALGPCLIQSLYGVAVGHLATEFDRSTYAGLVEHFAANGSRVRELLVQIAASDGFRYLPVPGSKP